MSATKLDEARRRPLDVSRERLEGLMLIRVVLVTVFLGSALALEAEALSNLTNFRNVTLLSLIVCTYVLTIIYAVLHRRVQSRRNLAIVQLTLDVIIVVVLTTATGGLNSPFSFLFFLNIINAAAVLGSRASAAVAFATALAFVWLALLDLGTVRLPFIYPIVRPFRNTVFMAALNTAAAFLIAALAGFLAARLGQATAAIARQRVDIEELRHLNRNILESLASGLVTVDTDSKIIFFNHAAEEITGRSADEVMGQKMSTIFPNIMSDESEDEASRQESHFVREDGELLYLGFSLSPLRDRSGVVRGQILIFQDLSEIRKMELEMRRSERLAAVGQLSASIAHEIRNPLAAISGAVELLDLPEAGKAQARLRDVVLTEVDRLNELISDFLEYCRPHQPALEIFDLAKLIDEVLELMERDQKAEDVEFETRLHDETNVWADPQALRQVIVNLLVNALEVEPRPSIIRIETSRTRSANGDDERLMIAVEDDGPGISEEQRKRLFEPFFTTKEGGSGLGLATAFRLMQDMHGVLRVTESGQLSGARFELEVPMQPRRRLDSSQNIALPLSSAS